MAKVAQVLSNLDENLFAFEVKKFCESSLALKGGVLNPFDTNKKLGLKEPLISQGRIVAEEATKPPPQVAL
jgi:hypothetical protein